MINYDVVSSGASGIYAREHLVPSNDVSSLQER